MIRKRMRAGNPPAQAPVVCAIADDPSMRRSLRRFLTVSEWRVQSFASAEAFLVTLLEKLSSGLLVADVRLPGISGLELLKRLQEGQILWPAVMMSGSNDESVEVEGLRLGAKTFLHKPFDPEVLLENLEELAHESNLKRIRSCGH
jgi:FixJ family two-component response regulator